MLNVVYDSSSVYVPGFIFQLRPHADPAFQAFENFSDSDAFRPGPLADDRLNTLQFQVELAPRPIAWDVGFDPKYHVEPSLVQIGNHKPVKQRYNSSTDWRNYGTPFTTLIRLLRNGTDGIHAVHPSQFNRENGVIHRSASGNVVLADPFSALFEQRPISFGDQDNFFVTMEGRDPDYGAGYEYAFFETTGSSTMPTSFRLDVAGRTPIPCCNRIPLNSFTGSNHDKVAYIDVVQTGFARNRWHYSDFELVDFGCTDLHFGMTLKYKVRIRATSSLLSVLPELISPHSDRTYQVTIDIHGRFIRYPRDFSFGAPIFPITTIVRCTFDRSYELIDAQDKVRIPSDYNWPIADYKDEWIEDFPISSLSQPMGSASERSPYSSVRPFYNSSKVADDFLPEDLPILFEQACLKVHPDIRGAASLSSADAYNTFVADANWLETIPELGSLISTLGLVTELGGIAKKAWRRDPSALEDLTDLIARAHLAYRYGIKPAKSDYEEARRIAETTVDDWRKLLAEFPDRLHGNFKYEIPATIEGLPGRWSVTIRSTVHLDRDVAGLLAAITTADSLGLLPEFQRLWDLQTFSFVVDWFANLGDRFRDISSNAILQGLNPTYYVHSFEYTLELDEAFLKPFRSVSPLDPPTLKLYIREPSRHHPPMRMGRFDFRSTDRYQDQDNLITMGALVLVTQKE